MFNKLAFPVWLKVQLPIYVKREDIAESSGDCFCPSPGCNVANIQVTTFSPLYFPGMNFLQT